MTRFILAWALLFAAPSIFSADKTRTYVYEYEVTGTSAAITVQQPASSARALQLRVAYFSCSTVECTATVEKNGTVTSGSTVTAVALDERGAATVSTTKTDATVTSGATVFTDTIPTDQKLVYASNLYLPAVSGAQKAITVSITAGSSSDLKVYLEWGEPQ